VKRALSKGWRWDDPEYLTRIIFCEMIKGSEDREAGFGIGTSQHGDVYKVVIINCLEKTVELEGLTWDTSSTLVKTFKEMVSPDEV